MLMTFTLAMGTRELNGVKVYLRARNQKVAELGFELRSGLQSVCLDQYTILPPRPGCGFLFIDLLAVNPWVSYSESWSFSLIG